MQVQTLQQWWDYVKSDDPLAKTRYFLRNWSGMGFKAEDVLEFLKTKVPFTCNRLYKTLVDFPLAGCYAIDWDHHHISFRFEPAPSITPCHQNDRRYSHFVICNDYAVEVKVS